MATMKEPSSRALSSDDVLLELRGVSFRYARDTATRSLHWQLFKDPARGGQLILDNISFSVKAGQRVLVVGPNGSGKSTLMSVIAGKRRPQSGRVRVWDGRDPFDDTSLNGEISFIGESWPPEASFGCTVDQITSGAAFPARRAAIAAALHLRLSRRVDFMSTGEKRRVQLLHGLLRPARVYLLDECSTNIDVAERQRVLSIVEEECLAGQSCCLYATHILDRLRDWATHVLLLREGRVVDFRAVEAMKAPLESLALGFMRDAASPHARRWGDDELALAADSEPFRGYEKDGIPAGELRRLQPILGELPNYFEDQLLDLPRRAEDGLAEVIACRELSYKDVFTRVSFSVYRGERVLLCGCNGSGKSTLLNMLGGKQYFNNDAKSLRVLGKVCYADMSFLAQVAYGGDWWTRAPSGEVYVRELLSPQTPRARWLCEVLAVNLDAEVGALSTGEQRRVQILLFLLEDRPVVLLDEATAELDLPQRDALLRFLYVESACRGVTVVYATHIFAGLSGWANALMVLDRTVRGVRVVERAPAGRAIDLESLPQRLLKLKSEENV